MLNEQWQHMHCETPSNPTTWMWRRRWPALWFFRRILQRQNAAFFPCPCVFRCDPGKCSLSKGGYRWYLRSDWVDHPDCDVAERNWSPWSPNVPDIIIDSGSIIVAHLPILIYLLFVLSGCPHFVGKTSHHPRNKMASGNRTMHAPADTLRGGRQPPQPLQGNCRISGSVHGRFSSNVQRKIYANLVLNSIEVNLRINHPQLWFAIGYRYLEWCKWRQMVGFSATLLYITGTQAQSPPNRRVRSPVLGSSSIDWGNWGITLPILDTQKEPVFLLNAG